MSWIFKTIPFLNYLFLYKRGIHILVALMLMGPGGMTWAQDQNVRINEIMSLNASVLQDNDGDYTDWIELYNPTDSDISLENWCLSDDKFNLKKWKFPKTIIKPDEYLIVFASGKNRRFSDWELHLNFSLHSAGEYLAFSDSTGKIISEFDPFLPALDTNNSYGVYNGIWHVYSTSSPGTANGTGIYTTIPPPVFSEKRGLYYEDFDLELSAFSPAAGIFYTTDGSAPDMNSNLYNGPLRINSTTVVRAIAITRGLESNIISHSFIFPEKVIYQGNNPAGYPAYFGPEGNTDYPADYEMDPEYIIDSGYADPVKIALTELPVVSLSTLKENLFSGMDNSVTGGIYMFPNADWERPVSFEYFDSKTGESYQVNAGIKITGGASRNLRNSPKKSFRICFRDIYGPTKLNYPVFGRENAPSFNNITLKAGYNNTIIHWDHDQREDATYINDIWMKDTQSSTGEPSGNSRYAHLYINGIYWGIFVIAERLDNNFCASYMRGDEEDFDVIKDYSEVLDGDNVAWDKLLTMVHQDVSQNENYYKIIGKNDKGEIDRNMTRYLEAENLVDYMLINFYGGNLDWDHHNWVAARNRNLGTEGFRFICWDSERTLELIGENVTNENNSNCPSDIFRSLLKNNEFKRLVENRIAKIFFGHGVLTEEACIERYEKRVAELEPAIYSEYARWGDYRRDVLQGRNGPYQFYTKDAFWVPQTKYHSEVYLKERTAIVINQLQSAGLFPNVEPPIFSIEGQTEFSNQIKKGDILSMIHNGSCFYTTDGTDPIDWNDTALTSSAMPYNQPFELDRSTLIKARVYLNGDWSAMSEENFLIPEDYGHLKLTEIHFNPADEPCCARSDYEFLEIKNTGSIPLNLHGLEFEQGISYRFQDEYLLEPGGFTVLASDRFKFFERYQFWPFGEYAGNLNNTGEEIVLNDPLGNPIISMTYSLAPGWPIANGAGHSIVPSIVNPVGNQDQYEDWRVSYEIGGSPGEDDIYMDTVINYTIEEKIDIACNVYPNPFTDLVQLNYYLPEDARLSVSVFNLTGREVIRLFDGHRFSGSHRLEWNGTDQAGNEVPGGMYFCKFNIQDINGVHVTMKRLIKIN